MVVTKNVVSILETRRKKTRDYATQARLVLYHAIVKIQYDELLHGIIPCISALGELRLRPPMPELSKHINIIYTSLYSISEGRKRQ